MEYADIVNVLRDVQKNNSREWYMQKKDVFREIHTVLSELYFDVANRLRKDTVIDIAPKKSISRPYNDQRFGNKPYLKDSLWVTFQSNMCPAPAFFIEFSPYGIRNGMGYYSATPAQMQDFRRKIDAAPQCFSDMIENVLTNEDIQIVGESYKKKFVSNYSGLLEEIYNYRSIYFQKILSTAEWGKLEQVSKEVFSELTLLHKWFIA